MFFFSTDQRRRVLAQQDRGVLRGQLGRLPARARRLHVGERRRRPVLAHRLRLRRLEQRNARRGQPRPLPRHGRRRRPQPVRQDSGKYFNFASQQIGLTCFFY